MLSHESCSFSYLGYWRVCERVEQIVFGQDHCPPDAFRINVLIRLERLVELSVGRRREFSSRQSKLWVGRTFGGMIAVRGDILCEGSKWLRWPQLAARALDER